MKLILCPVCQDVRKLMFTETRCQCGLSWGQYLTGLDAMYGGRAIPLGFDSSSLVRAVRQQPSIGMGAQFEAFIIPKECSTFKQKTNPIQQSGKDDGSQQI